MTCYLSIIATLGLSILFVHALPVTVDMAVEQRGSLHAMLIE